jgi:archaellum component FlaC
MNKDHISKLALFSILLLMTSPLQAKGQGSWTYCWDNEDDVRECSSYISPEYSQKGFHKCRKGVCEYVKPAPTPDEIAELERQKDEKRKYEEQLRKDEALLALFSSEKDIKSTRDAQLNHIDGQIQSIETILEGLKGNLEDLEESYERSLQNTNVSKSQLDAIQRNVDSVKKRVEDTEGTLQKKQNERKNTEDEYGTFLARFIDILQRRGGVLPLRREKE